MSMTRHGGIQHVRYLCYDFEGKRYNKDKNGRNTGKDGTGFLLVLQ